MVSVSSLVPVSTPLVPPGLPGYAHLHDYERDLRSHQDGAPEYDPDDYMKLLTPIVEDKADVIYVSRFIGEPDRVLCYWHCLPNRLLTKLRTIFTNLNLHDMEVCCKVFKTRVLQSIQVKSDRFNVKPDLTAEIIRIRPRLRIYEVGVACYGHSYEDEKKVTWKDGVKSLYCVIRLLVGRLTAQER